jgi:hypothetical protein
MTQTSTIQRVQEYKGKNSFIGKMKDTLTKYGKLTPKQEEVVVNILEKEESEVKNTRNFNINVIGETLKVGRAVGQGMKEKYELQFNGIT